MKNETLLHNGRRTDFSYSVPDATEKAPVVLFAHGYNGYMTDFDETRKRLIENGIASAALTFSGGSTRDLSGFPSTGMTLHTEKEDLLALIEWAENRNGSIRIGFLFSAEVWEALLLAWQLKLYRKKSVRSDFFIRRSALWMTGMKGSKTKATFLMK